VIGERSSVFEIPSDFAEEENLREDLVVLGSNENLAKICIKRDDFNIISII
jgi:hypothetical protein